MLQFLIYTVTTHREWTHFDVMTINISTWGNMRPRLKDRELEVLALMAERQSNQEIADTLGIGYETVRWYARHIYEKLHVSNRKEAATKAIELGLLETQDSTETQSSTAQFNQPPHQLSSFVGRAEHLTYIQELLKTNRLITLVGTGGTGKTRLAIEVTKHVKPLFPDGIIFIDLTTINDPKDIPELIADALRIPPREHNVIDHLAQSISSKQVLLFVDNMEHVMDGVMYLHEILTTTNTPKMLVTSREVLNLHGEQVYDIPPLMLDISGNDDIPEAVDLFVQRAQQLKSSFTLTADNQENIQWICKRVDGLPLAIELLATHIRFFSPSQLRQNLDNQMTLPASRRRDIPDRHRTITNTIDWSYQLLSDSEKALFAQLSIFRGGASLEAIQAICKSTGDVLEDLARLLEKSMVRQTDDSLDEPRFSMLETLQAYAYSKLEAAGAIHALSQQHAQYYAGFVEHAATHLRRTHQEYWFTKLDIEYSNIKQALRWAIDNKEAIIAIQMVTHLRDYWWYQGKHRDGWYWVQAGLHLIDTIPAGLLAKFYLTASYTAYYRQEIDLARDYGLRSYSLYESLGDVGGMGWTLTLTKVGTELADDARLTLFEETLALLHRAEDEIGITFKLNSYALYLMARGAYDEAIEKFRQCLTMTQRIGERRREAIVQICLGEIALRQQQIASAREYFYAGLSLSQQLNFTYQLHDALWMCIIVFIEFDDIESATQLWGAASNQKFLTGQDIYPDQLQLVNPYINQLEAEQVASSHIQQRYDNGYQMFLDDAVDFALATLKALS